MVFTFEDGLAKLKGKASRKLENNTYLVKVDDATLGVKLHNTVVVYIFKSGIYQLDTGGWRSVTTKDRMNKYSPALVYQDQGLWYVNNGIYEDGVRLDSTGKVLTPQRGRNEVEAKKRKLDRMVRKYINGFVQHVFRNGLQLGIEPEPKPEPWKVVKLTDSPEPMQLPGPGDCWSCYFGLSSDDPLKEPLGMDHLLDHMTEEYYVPSLLWKAIVTAGYKDPGLIWSQIASEAKRGQKYFLDQRVLTPYFRKRKKALLELME